MLAQGSFDLNVHYIRIVTMLQSKIRNFAKDTKLNGINSAQIIHKAIRSQGVAKQQKQRIFKHNTIDT